MSAFDDMKNAVEEAETTLRRVKYQARVMIHIVVGNLRQGNHSDLVSLKRELANFDSRTGTWKN